MRIETLPLILGAIVALLGVALIADAWLAEDLPPLRERRRRARAERSRPGEALCGVGALCMSAALMGRDTWRYGTLATLLGALLLVLGAGLNWRFLREAVAYRGPARRSEEEQRLPGMPEQTPPEHLRLR
jgi:hypothetical protein